MEPHFAAPVPPDMPLMVRWSALPFTTPGNVGTTTLGRLVETHLPKSKTKIQDQTLPKYKFQSVLRPPMIFSNLITTHDCWSPTVSNFPWHSYPTPGRGQTWGDNPNADTCHQLHRDARRGVGVLQVLHVGETPGEPLAWFTIETTCPPWGEFTGSDHKLR